MRSLSHNRHVASNSAWTVGSG